jgi:hypothetical protein
MKLRTRLSALVKAILEEADKNPDFAARVEAALGSVLAEQPRRALRRHRFEDASERSRQNRRKSAVLDPISLARDGETVLRSQLGELSLEQLRDIVADYGMDTGKLVMKWKEPERVIDRIVEISIVRAKKGDVFLKS